MEVIRLNINKEIIYAAEKGPIDTIFNFCINDEYYFPDSQWTDFTYPLLVDWTSILLKYWIYGYKTFYLCFLDGPYEIKCRKKGDELKLFFINFRENKQIEWIGQINYNYFLYIVYKALYKFTRSISNSKKLNYQYNQCKIMLKRIRKIIVPAKTVKK